MTNLCEACGKRPAIFLRQHRRPNGKLVTLVSADNEHTLCRQCQRSATDREKAQQHALFMEKE